MSLRSTCTLSGFHLGWGKVVMCTENVLATPNFVNHTPIYMVTKWPSDDVHIFWGRFTPAPSLDETLTVMLAYCTLQQTLRALYSIIVIIISACMYTSFAACLSSCRFTSCFASLYSVCLWLRLYSLCVCWREGGYIIMHAVQVLSFEAQCTAHIILANLHVQ